ncbi:MAG: rRNA maturation RNase YbeY [Defluviitaleaceae bacterium]|nr:rRNA maturation RNase YbeY [Defluviitaleaceae bacterium]
MIDIFVDNNTKEDLADLSEIVRRAAIAALNAEGIIFPLEISILFVGDEEMAELSRDFRGVFATTDVLSFPQQTPADIRKLNEAANAGENQNAVPLGDVVIAIDTARHQAEEYGHSIQREVAFLAVHSVLHLLGYDHKNDEDDSQMNLKQEQILEKIGLGR